MLSFRAVVSDRIPDPGKMHQTSFPPLEVITLGMLDADNFTTDPEGIGSTPERAIDEEVIFVGHSVGGSVLLSYLAVARTRSLSGRSPQ
jgi:hypothetical protein